MRILTKASALKVGGTVLKTGGAAIRTGVIQIGNAHAAAGKIKDQFEKASQDKQQDDEGQERAGFQNPLPRRRRRKNRIRGGGVWGSYTRTEASWKDGTKKAPSGWKPSAHQMQERKAASKFTAAAGKEVKTAEQVIQKAVKGSAKAAGKAAAGAAKTAVSAACPHSFAAKAVGTGARMAKASIKLTFSLGKKLVKNLTPKDDLLKKLAAGFSLSPLLFGTALCAVVTGFLFGCYEYVYSDEEKDIYIEAVYAEYEESDNNIGGYKYKEWYGMDDNWCVMFVCYCADQVGLVEAGIFPEPGSGAAASCYLLQQYFYTNNTGCIYTIDDCAPIPGSLVFFSFGHVGVIVDVDYDAETITVISGNSGGDTGDDEESYDTVEGEDIYAPSYHETSRVSMQIYAWDNFYITEFIHPAYAYEDVYYTDILGISTWIDRNH